MNKDDENPPSFLPRTFLILQAIFRRKDDPQIRLEDGSLFLDREELRPPAIHLSEAQLKDRVRELARRVGLPDISAHPLAEIWYVELSKRALSARELVECGRFASFQRDPHEADLVKRWRDEFLPRLANHLPDLNAVERFDDSATPQDREKKIELAPILEDWPRRILEDPYWKYAEAPLPEMEPLALDDVWVDMFLSDPLETHEEGRLAESFEMRDERQRWLTEPAAFVLERIYGATALIGPPGCGKTTLLKWFARQLIANPQGRFLLPLFVPLRKYARARFGNTPAPSGDLLEFALRQCGITHPAQLQMWTTTISYLTGGDRSRVLMMLDGWDEVPAEYRDLLLKEIDDLAYGFAILITSRPSGFPRLLPVNHFYEIASLSHDSSERLIRRWFAAAGVEAQAEAVMHHLDEHPDLRRLARNPFLLSLLCGICRRQTEYSDVSRTSLYRQAINLIVAHHNRQHPRAITSLEQRQIERMALWLQADAPNAPRYVFDRADAQACLNETASLEAVLPSRLLSQLHLDQESFHFLHTTFQEYLAARGLLAETPAKMEQRLQQRAYDLNWQEILCFAAGEASDEKIMRVFWQRLAAIARQPDRFGLIFVRLARFIAEAAVDDGGKVLLGIDLREELWRAIERGVEVNTFVDAYAEVDPAGLLERIKEQLNDSCDEATRARYLRAMGRVKSRENSQALVNTILQGDDHAAAIASYTGHRVLDAEGFHALRAAVGDETLSERQRVRAMRTLANLRDSSITATLQRIAAAPAAAKHSLSIEAIKALGRIGDSAASSALSELLSDASDSTCQVLLISALGDARDPAARDRLIEEIVSRLPDDPLVPSALEALAAKPFYAGTDTVAELLKCDDPRVRAAAAQAMGDSARTVYGHELARIALEDLEKPVRMAALRSLVNQGGPQAIYQLAQIVNDGPREEDERAEALTTSLLVFARLNAMRDTSSLSLLRRLALSALQTPRGQLALAAASHAHLLGDEVAGRLLEICQDDEASDAVREESCRSLARILSIWRRRHHELTPKAGDALLDLARREPNARNDEEIPNLDAHERLAQAAAHALAEIDAVRLLREQGTTSLNALAAFSVRTGCLVFEDRIIADGGATFAAEAEAAESNTEHYDIALSFAGQDRPFAEELAAALREHGVKVFYDADKSFDLWGKDLYAHLADLYQNRAHFCVMFLSRHYATALWTNHERKAAQARAFRESREFILPIRLDDTPIEGVLDTTAFMRWEEYGAEQIANAIIKKLHAVSAKSDVSPVQAPSVTRVNSPEISPDFEYLNRVRRLSDISAFDAETIIQNQEDQMQEEVSLGDDLYVARNIEAQIHARLDQALQKGGSPASILVAGEAGHGKTCLLWHLHHKLNESGRWEAWFIKSSMLSLPSQPGGPNNARTLPFDDLLKASAGALAQGFKPILLLDTVDVLLHGDYREREVLIESLLELMESGCSLIATCRPQEAALLGPLKKGSLRLKEYEGRELTEAIDKHVARFYAHADLQTREDHRKQINSVVARGLPLREVCVNPLTLRMMFLLYAPNPVPPEINIFDLYNKYWNDRVVADRRGGDPDQRHTGVNLEKTAAQAALVMLAEGKPELPAERLTDGVIRIGGDASKIDLLVSRGVLHRQAEGTLQFFHQTFFEHSAARGMLDAFEAEGLSLVEARLSNRPHDLFLSPVYEQALLLSENRTGSIHLKAEELLSNLFRTGSLIERSSAAYVYAHKKSVPEKTSQQFREVLRGAETALVVRFLTVAPNLAAKRLPSLLEELDVIWGRQKWEEHSHALELLERLAVREPQRVLDFIARYDIHRYVLSLPVQHQGVSRLLRVYIALAVNQPEYSWEAILQLYCAGSKTDNQDLKVSIISLLCDHAGLFQSDGIATEFERAVNSLAADAPNLFSEAIPQAFGRLWAVEWRKKRVPVAFILHEINSNALNPEQLRARIYGVVELIAESGGREDALKVFENFANDQHTNRQWLWARMCLSGLLGKLTHDTPPSPAVQCIREKIIEVFSSRLKPGITAPESLLDRELSVRLFPMAREAVVKANLPPALLAELLDFKEAQQPKVWLQKDILGELLAEACIGGHTGATQALQKLAQSPSPSSEEMVVSASIHLSRLALNHPEAIHLHLSIAAKDAKPEGAAALVRTLELLQPPVTSIDGKVRERLNAFRESLFASRSAPTRRIGASLWQHLLRLELCPPPAMSEIKRKLEGEHDLTTRAELATLLGRAATIAEFDENEVAAILIPMARKTDQKLGKAALTALVAFIIERPADAPEYVLQALEVALAAPTDSGRPTLFGNVIEFLLYRNQRLAVEVLERILRAPSIAVLGKQARKDIANRLRSPARNLVRMVSKEERDHLLSLVPSLDVVLQRVVVEAVCHEVFDQSVEELNHLLSESGLAESTVELIRRHKYTRERAVGSETWIDLYSLLASGKS